MLSSCVRISGCRAVAVLAIRRTATSALLLARRTSRRAGDDLAAPCGAGTPPHRAAGTARPPQRAQAEFVLRTRGPRIEDAEARYYAVQTAIASRAGDRQCALRL